jgi:ABC-type uncharacterized transport system permease subunit
MGMAAFLALYYAGASVQLTPDEAALLREEFGSKIEGIEESGIFINNIVIAFVMFIPAIGAGFGMFAGYSTGMIFSALAESNPALFGVSPLAIMLTPFGIMEVFSYGLAMSRSSVLIYQLVKKKPWREYVVPTLIELGIVAAVLFAAALVEWWMIQQSGGLDLDSIKSA